MKNWIFLFLSVFLFTGCSKKDEENAVIAGEWILVQISGYGMNENGEYEYSETDVDSEIIYDFQQNGNLTIKNKEDNSQTVHTYFFGKDYLAGDIGTGDSKILLVKIDDSKYTYQLDENGIMTLGKSYVDGYDLHFKRKSN